jgi:hypothetical protein
MKKHFYLAAVVTAAVFPALSQDFIYSSVSINPASFPAASVSGNGAWASPTVLSSYSISIQSASNRINSVSTNLGGAADEVNAVNPWETKYGQINPNTTSTIKVRSINNSSSTGQPLRDPITTTVNFGTATPAENWGFMVLDIDVDQVTIRATAPDGTYYSVAEINSWFKGTMRMSTNSDATTPHYDASTGTVVGFDYGAARQTTLKIGNEVEGSAAYFEPDVPVKTIEFIFDNLQPNTGTPSQRYFIAARTQASLPVNLLRFDARREETAVVLNWATASETGNEGFEVQRSADARKWEALSFVPALSENGDSEELLAYAFTDRMPLSGQNYYRLKQVDLDGKFEYSPIRAVFIGENEPSGVQVYPNPTARFVTLSKLNGGEKIQVFDARGRLLHSRGSDGTTVDISLENYREGIYFIHVQHAGGKVSYHKVVKKE